MGEAGFAVVPGGSYGAACDREVFYAEEDAVVGDGAGADAEDLPIVGVGRYPKVGDVAELVCSNAHQPGLLHWRRSSWVAGIERICPLEGL